MNLGVQNVVLRNHNSMLRNKYKLQHDQLSDKLDIIETILHKFGSKAFGDPNTPKQEIIAQLELFIESEKTEAYSKGEEAAGCGCDHDEIYQEGYTDGENFRNGD